MELDELLLSLGGGFPYRSIWTVLSWRPYWLVAKSGNAT